MASFKFLTLASASLFLLQGTYTKAASGSGTQNIKAIDCLAPVNDARALVGFPSLKAPAQADENNGLQALLKKTESGSLKGKLCAAVKSATGAGTLIDLDMERGLAYHDQTGTDGDCAAAVTHFKAGFAGLGSEKPGQYQSGAAPFNTGNTVSFASIYYPKEGEIECAYVICGEEAGSGTEGAGGSSQTQSSANAGATPAAGKNVLVCMTKPPTLVKGKEPFTDEEFKAFQKLQGSGANSVPTFLALVAAAAGIALL